MEPQRRKLSEAPAWRWLTARPMLFDAVVAVFLAAATLIVAVSGELTSSDGVLLRTPDAWYEWLLIVGAAWAVPFRRVAPTHAVVVGGVLQAIVWGFGYPDTYMALAVLLFSAAAYGGTQGQWLSWLVGAVLTGYTVLGVAADEAPFYVIPLVALLSAAATSFGMITAGRQVYTKAMEDRARELERSRKADRDRALVEERARIARELHDVVAHGLSVIVVQASAAQRIQDRDPAGTASALQQIEQTGRNALNEMRQVLGAIRTEPAESWQPAPGLDGLDELILEMGNTGLQVTVTHEVDEASDSLPGTVDLTAYRIIQESLTNVLKHGGRRAKAAVTITRRAGALALSIVDDGRGAGATNSDGHGLRGMQERVEVFGGTFAAGPQPDGGFAVSVSLPLDGADVAG